MRVLFVCSGNTCRSAMAEGLLRESLSIAPGEHEVRSAGTQATPGAPASEHALAATREVGVLLADHRAQSLTRDAITWADAVLCVTAEHVAACEALAGSGAPAVLLSAFDAEPGDDDGEDITDPVRDIEGGRRVRDRLRRCGDRFLAERGVLAYAPYWCEENIWYLLGDERLAAADCYALVLSNPARAVAMWSQRAALVPGTPVAWDYHVVALTRGDDEVRVWDPDCARGRLLSLAEWLAVSFPFAAELPLELQPLFRVVPAARYRESFVSDRSHMRTEDGRLLHAAPPWAPIGVGENSLPALLDMQRPGDDDVHDLARLRRRFLEENP